MRYSMIEATACLREHEDTVKEQREQLEGIEVLNADQANTVTLMADQGMQREAEFTALEERLAGVQAEGTIPKKRYTSQGVRMDEALVDMKMLERAVLQ